LSQNVILKVVSFSVSTEFAIMKMDLAPVGDVLYSVEVPEGGYIEEEGKKIFNIKGIRHIVTQAEVALVVDADEEDF